MNSRSSELIAQHKSNMYSRRKEIEYIDSIAEGLEYSTGDHMPKIPVVPFKIVMLGDSNVGKTSIVERFINDTYG